MLLSNIKKNQQLTDFIKDNCSDEGMCVEIDDKIAKNEYLVIKVDDYYNSLGLADTPAAPDCLIVIKCKNNGYALAIVELKNIDKANRFNIENITQKFTTCFNDFMSERFKDYFDHDFQRIQLFFVTKINIHSSNKDPSRGLRLEALINKRFKFRNRNYMIRAYNPSPLIKPCYS